MTARFAWAAVAVVAVILMKPRQRFWAVRGILAAGVAWALWKVDESGVPGQPFSSARLLAPGLTSMIIVLVLGAVAAGLIGVGWRPR